MVYALTISTGYSIPKPIFFGCATTRQAPSISSSRKILARHEAVREDWPVQGTTGYEFASLVLGLLIDPSGEDGLSQTYTGFVRRHRSFDEIVRECKIRIMLNEMASELNVLARD